MAFCSNCGVQLNDSVNFCHKCGTRVGTGGQSGANNAADFVNKTAQKINQVMDTPDSTAHFDPRDIADNKVLAILAYIGPFALIPYFVEKQSLFVRFHAVRGMYLFMLYIAGAIATGILRGIFWYAWPLATFLSSIVGLCIVALSIVGIIYAAQGKAKDLPVVGSMIKWGWFK